jgi:hypothetical protein
MSTLYRKCVKFGIPAAFFLYSVFKPPDTPPSVPQIIDIINVFSGGINPPEEAYMALEDARSSSQIISSIQESCVSEPASIPPSQPSSFMDILLESIYSNYDRSKSEFLVV